jgi:hypothetical protein
MMSRKSYALAIAIVVLFVGSTGAGVVLLFHHVPAFYKRCAILDGPQREKWSDEFESEAFNRLMAGIISEQAWSVKFNENQINAYLAEALIKKHSRENPWPVDVSEPRVSLGDDRIRLGFRYGRGSFSTVISVELRAWLAIQEPNVMAFEILSLSAGAVPISAQSLLDHMAETARKQKIDISFYRYYKHPVLLLHFQADRTNPTFQLRQFKVEQGTVNIGGRAVDKPKA